MNTRTIDVMLPAVTAWRHEAQTVTLGTGDDLEHLNPSTRHHVEWEALPTKRHQPDDEPEAPGAGEEGWGIYLAEDKGEGYFAWLPDECAAKALVEDHNAAVRAALAEEDE